MQPISTPPARIIVADSNDLLLIGARLILEQHPDSRLVSVAPDFETLLAVTTQHLPHVVVFDDRLDHDLDVWSQVEQLQAVAPETKFVVMTIWASGPLIHEFLSHGIDAVLCKSDELQTHLYHAILAVLRNRPYLSPTANTEYLVMVRDSCHNDRLDLESRTVLHLLVQGQRVGQIAYHLQIPLRRVYWVREKLRRRFGANSNEHLVRRATTEGFISPHD